MDEGDLRLVLRDFIASHLPGADNILITGLTRLGGGASTENWSFDAAWFEGGTPVAQQLILRRAPDHEVVVTTRAQEFRILQAVNKTPIPAPRAFWMDGDGTFFQRPAMVLERCGGYADRKMLNGTLARETRLGLASEMVDILVALHNLDASALDLPREEGYSAPGQLAILGEEMRRNEIEPMLELRLAEWWLRDNLPPPPRRQVLVHGDFRPGNMLVQDGRISAVLDWELAHRGDPMEDLGWYLAPNYRAEHFIEQAWTPEDFIRHYEAISGIAVDRAALRFWRIFAVYKLCLIALATITAFRRGDRNRIAVAPEHLVVTLMEGIAGEPDWTEGTR